MCWQGKPRRPVGAQGAQSSLWGLGEARAWREVRADGSQSCSGRHLGMGTDGL